LGWFGEWRSGAPDLLPELVGAPVAGRQSLFERLDSRARVLALPHRRREFRGSVLGGCQARGEHQSRYERGSNHKLSLRRRRVDYLAVETQFARGRAAWSTQPTAADWLLRRHRWIQT